MDADLDGDEDVDLVDFALFQSYYTGPDCSNLQSSPATEDWLSNFTRLQGVVAHNGVVYANYGRKMAAFLPCNVPPQDVDADQDVDLDDYTIFASCYNGGSAWPQACVDCACLDYDDDGDVDVRFDLRSPQADQTVTAGTAVEWKISVCVAGDNRGLGGFNCSLFLGPNAGPGPGPDGRWGTRDDENLANVYIGATWWLESFAVAGGYGKPMTGAQVDWSGSGGGPGMNVMTSGGYNDRPGALLQIGTGYLTWDPWRYNPVTNRWVGSHVWGVGTTYGRAGHRGLRRQTTPLWTCGAPYCRRWRAHSKAAAPQTKARGCRAA